MIEIRAKENARLKEMRALASKKGRQKTDRLLVEGMRLAQSAWESGCQIDYAVCTAAAAAKADALLTGLEQRQIPCYLVSEGLLATVSATEHSQGLVLVARRPALPLPAGEGYWLILDRVADPGNVGTILRSAHAAGAQAVLLGPGCADPDNPKAVRASMGAVFYLPRYQASEEELARLCAVRRLPLYVAAGEGENIYAHQDRLQSPHAWVLGSEAQGVGAFWRQQAAGCYRLPMRRAAESLNVAAAASVLLYLSAAAQGFAAAMW